MPKEGFPYKRNKSNRRISMGDEMYGLKTLRVSRLKIKYNSGTSIKPVIPIRVRATTCVEESF